MSPVTKRNISRIIPFGIIWFLFSIVYSLLERGIIGNLDHYPATGNPYNFNSNILITPISALLTGLLIGTAEIMYFNKLFLLKSFTGKIIYKTLIYFGIITLFVLSLTVLSNSFQLHASVFSKQVWNNVWIFFFNYSFWGVEIFIASIILVSLFYMEVSENLGVAVLNNFFTGKYHSPKEEERVFMFLDMKSSTTIAESLGHVKYFEMLNKYYADLSGPIIKYSGEIYQYVGDEVIVSWKLKSGIQNNTCIRCFFAMKESLRKQTSSYNEKFGLTPEFKAGFHYGKVTAGEIGVIKKDITFTGDVLNTTSRIQGLCNTHKVDILVSGQLIEKMNLQTEFQITDLGKAELRGRDEKIKLYTIHLFENKY
jgi:class 3 adenylate cyclase